MYLQVQMIDFSFFQSLIYKNTLENSILVLINFQINMVYQLTDLHLIFEIIIFLIKTVNEKIIQKIKSL